MWLGGRVLALACKALGSISRTTNIFQFCLKYMSMYLNLIYPLCKCFGNFMYLF